MTHQTPNFFLRDLAGLVLLLLFAAALVVVAFLTNAGPFILIAVLIVLIFALLRTFRERGRDAEAQEVFNALRTRLNAGEELLAAVAGDRRRVKPLVALADFALLMLSQGLAADGSGALAVDDTFMGMTNQRLIAIDRQKRRPGQKRDWRERLNLRARDAVGDASKGKHRVVFETPCWGLSLSVRLGVFYLARLNVRAVDGRTFSIGLNSRFWAEQAVVLMRRTEDARSGGHEGRCTEREPGTRLSSPMETDP